MTEKPISIREDNLQISLFHNKGTGKPPIYCINKTTGTYGNYKSHKSYWLKKDLKTLFMALKRIKGVGTK